jgi:hypothetical protein
MINLGFLTEGKLAAIFIKTFSWDFPTCRSFNFIYHQLGPIKFSGAVAGEEWKTSARGVFLHAHPLLCYCFALLYLFYLHHFISKTQKN